MFKREQEQSNMDDFISQEARDRLLQELLSLRPESGEKIKKKSKSRIAKQEKQLQEIEAKQQELVVEERKLLEEQSQLEKEEQALEVKLQQANQYSKAQQTLSGAKPEQFKKPWKQQKEEVEQSANELVKLKNVWVYLCPALQTVSNDAFEIAKITTPILAGLIIAGSLSIPLGPFLFASIALIISRMSIASICADYNEKDHSNK